jgi:hypothetical protein
MSSLTRERIAKGVRDDFRRDGQEPQPPVVEVDYGNGKRLIEHKGHDVYLDLMQEFNANVLRETGERLKRYMVRRCVVADVDLDAVATIRRDMAEIGIDLSDDDDLLVYVWYVCIATDPDWQLLLDVVMTTSRPSEADIDAHAESFRSDIPREAAMVSGA